MTRILEHTPEDLYPGRRVYVKNSDIFGKINAEGTHVIYENPMPDFKEEITDKLVIYDSSHGDW